MFDEMPDIQILVENQLSSTSHEDEHARKTNRRFFFLKFLGGKDASLRIKQRSHFHQPSAGH